MNRLLSGLALTLSHLLLIGCAVEPLEEEDEESTAESASEIITSNALNANALNANALNANALNANALNANALAAIQAPGESGSLSRHLLKYVVSCALARHQSFSFTWTDEAGTAHDETYPGEIGLAPSWATQPLDVTGQRWVTACLASRVNYYGVSVILSARGDHPMLNEWATPLTETLFYNKLEGAFWGNIFAPEPAVYACYNGLNKTYSRSKRRDCAAGHQVSSQSIEECGPVEIVGDCSEHCSGLNLGLYYNVCQLDSSAPLTSEVVTVYLK